MDFNNKMFFIVMSIKFIALLGLGLSFARIQVPRPHLIPLAFLTLGTLFWLWGSNALLRSYRLIFLQFGVSGILIVGAYACLHQYLHLKNRTTVGTPPRSRLKKLLLFSLLSLTLAFLNSMQFTADFPRLWRVVFWGVPDFSFVLFLGMIALSDYRRQTLLIEHAPVSEYHRRPHLPESLKGTLLILDIKSSEAIYRNAQPGFEGMMATIISQLAQVFTEFGATIIKAEGDELIAFVDHDRQTRPTSQTLKACLRCVDHLKDFTLKYPQVLEATTGSALLFRAAMAEGEIQPSWIGVGSSRYPSWNQVGEHQVFVDASRLLEIERQLPDSKAQSLLVLAQGLEEKLRAETEVLASRWITHNQNFQGKHGRDYRVSALRLSAPPQTKLTLLVA